jgi:hypothetical protein
MSLATLIGRSIAALQTRCARPFRLSAAIGIGLDGRFRPHRSDIARWRSPWLVWQLLSWAAGTLLAPAFWIVGILLAINSHSDQPFFWSMLMVIVAASNAIAIVHTNQRHHRWPFMGSARIFGHYLAVAMIVGCAMFLLLAWSTGALEAFAGMLGTATGISGLAQLMVGTLVATLAFGLTSFVPASVLHVWLAFDA